MTPLPAHAAGGRVFDHLGRNTPSRVLQRGTSDEIVRYAPLLTSPDRPTNRYLSALHDNGPEGMAREELVLRAWDGLRRAYCGG